MSGLLSGKLVVWSLVVVLATGFCLVLCFGHEGHQHSGICSSAVGNSLGHHHHHNDHLHHHECGGHARGHHLEFEDKLDTGYKLPEELAEEEDMRLYGFGLYGDHEHDHDHGHAHFGTSELSGLGLWVNALGCSFLVSMASLICLIILPLMFVQGRPSKAVVDSLALFGAGAMLGDAFLHQLPHAFGGGHSHSHDSHAEHDHGDGSGHKHAHSLEDLSIGISVLAGIVLFLLVEKVVRFVEANSGEANSWTHGHHHHHHKSCKKLKDDNDSRANLQSETTLTNNEVSADEGDETVTDFKKQEENQHAPVLRKRTSSNVATEDNSVDVRTNGETLDNLGTLKEKEYIEAPTNLVFGYLNLFSDGVHNFTDGMALGSAFLLYGSVGGWSRTLFLLAHEIPQEVGDFGILVRSGFSVSKALFFNFLSALVALAGTALALLWGQDPGQSSLIEGFTAGGFIYISVAGVLAEINGGNTAIRSTVIQLTSLILGMSVALCISLVE